MSQLINEAKRMQELANIKEDPDKMANKIAMANANAAPNTPPGATPGKNTKLQGSSISSLVTKLNALGIKDPKVSIALNKIKSNQDLGTTDNAALASLVKTMMGTSDDVALMGVFQVLKDMEAK